MFHCILYQPEIPPNTGNIIRLCANALIQLHLIRPLGFALDDKKMQRAGLDYHEWTSVKIYDSLEICLQDNDFNRIFACSTKGQTCYAQPIYQPEDAFLFGPETRGLPLSVLQSLPMDQVIRIPMQENSRSLNLSNSVAVILYEALRQSNFDKLS